MGLLDWIIKPKCFSCRTPFTKTSVPKHVRNAQGVWIKLCTRCYTGMGGKPRVNVTTDAYKNRQAREKAKREKEAKQRAENKARDLEIRRLGEEIKRLQDERKANPNP